MAARGSDKGLETITAPQGYTAFIDHRVTIDELDAAVAELKGKDYSIISTFDTHMLNLFSSTPTKQLAMPRV